MKKLIILLFIASMFVGCTCSTIKEKISRNAAHLDGYVQRMETGEPMPTLPEEDQDLIRAMRVWTWEMNQLLNDETPPEDIRKLVEDRLRARGE